jgi:hypothetical protein
MFSRENGVSHSVQWVILNCPEFLVEMWQNIWVSARAHHLNAMVFSFSEVHQEASEDDRCQWRRSGYPE